MSAGRRIPADLGPRVAVAVPAAALLLALTAAGGPWFAVPLGLIGAAGHAELCRLTAVTGSPVAPGALLIAAAPVLALADAPGVAGAGVLAATAAGAALAPGGARTRAAAVTLGGAVWLGGCLAHAVLLRELPHGFALVVAVLLATFVGDTAAQLVGTAFGRRRLAPAISPNKTVEGLAAGVAAGTAACLAFAAAEPDALSAPGGLALGLACALAAPAGDLLESALKRRAGVKDSGRAFGPHGGVLDRIDAVIVAAAVGYHVARAVT